MKLKTVDVSGTTYAVVADGKPVYVADDGTETGVDLPGTAATISRLNAEAKGHRERAEKAESALRSFEGLDPGKARDALEKITNLDAKKLIDAGEAERVRAEAIKAVEEKYKPIIEERDGLRSTLEKALIGNAFAQSSFVAERLTPAGADLIRKMYGDRLRVEDDKIVPLDANGNPLLSRVRPGENADIDEAIAIYVESYPHKDHIMIGNNNSGSGARASNGSGNIGRKTMSRSEFDRLPPADQGDKVRSGFKVVDGG